MVIAAIPSFWDALLQRAPQEVRQLINRCQPIIRYSDVEEKGVRRLLSDVLNANVLNSVIRDVMDAAMSFGAYATVTAIRNDLRSIDSPGEEDVAKIIKTLRASWIDAGVSINTKAIKR
ncbi:MAG: hypothetical protein FWF84_02475 [Kiritimatiellaeota bacterium]|nr:hypothetical protein [Kiritimatiellota bacterium]